ncbi:MAG: 3-deoxy-7-phosphoheptulonate synthase [Parcubacteria group bacterium]|nr:3-deoxy-7-phosphoheptulonate synthase [Parcubacteria group bacterium]
MCLQSIPGQLFLTIMTKQFSQENLEIIAGPCAVESKEQILKTAEFLQKAGLKIMRGSIHKPRTTADSFQGVGNEGLSWIKEAKEKHDLKWLTEITDSSQIRDMEAVVDFWQVGARNMQNYELLKALAQQDKPVFLKRGLAADLKDWLGAASYLKVDKNPEVVLVERGIRTFSDSSRFTLDLAAVNKIRRETDYTVFVDPSHAAGEVPLVEPLALAGVVAGASGLVVEIHPQADKALCDGQQMLDFTEMEKLIEKVQAVSKLA